MSVSTTIFNGTTIAAQVEELNDFLQENALGYFDSITYDEENGITCTIDETNVFTCSVTGIRKITFRSGASCSDGGAGWKSISRAYLSDNGLMIIGTYSTTSDRTVVISKTAEGETAIVMCYSNDGTYPQRTGISAFVPNKSESVIFCNGLTGSSSEYSTVRYYLTMESGKTVLAPVVFPNSDYCKHVFFTPFTQYRTLNYGIITVNSTEYAYNGMFAVN